MSTRRGPPRKVWSAAHALAAVRCRPDPLRRPTAPSCRRPRLRSGSRSPTTSISSASRGLT